jgi:hypothetical protein
MKFQLRDVDAFTKHLFIKNKIENSSQFVVFAYYIHKKFYTKMAERIRPILALEHSNREATWTANAIYSHEQTLKLNSDDLYHVMIAYRLVLDYFLNDDVLGKIFRMDEEDSVGWRIYKELDSKYIWTKRRMESKQYVEQNQTA